MKKILVPIILIAVFSTVTAWAQTERPASIEALRSEHDAQWYAHQTALWEKEVQKNPNDDEAWYYWFTFTKSKFANAATKNVDLDVMAKEMAAIANRLHKERPNSYARYIIDFNYDRMFGNRPDYLDDLVIIDKTPKLDNVQDNMLKAIKMRPDFEPMYPSYVAYLVQAGRTDLMTDILKRWYNTGNYSYTMLSYAYNCMAGMEKNGILFVSGEEETFACLMVQYGKGLFQDRLIINLNLLQEPDYLTNHMIRLCIGRLLSYCKRFFEQRYAIRSTPGRNLRRALDTMIDNYLSSGSAAQQGQPTVSWCADQFNLTPNYFSSLIKRELRMPAQDYIQGKILDAAKKLLDTTAMSVGEIAEELGFSYPNHFTRLFKSKTGQSPQQYRKSR